MSGRLITLLALIVLTVGSSVADAGTSVAVTTCGQVVPKKATGYLTGDLDCTGFTGAGPNPADTFYAGAAVYLDRANLDLRGFTLTGGLRGVVCDSYCGRSHCPRPKCTIYRGRVQGSTGDGDGIAGDQLTIHDVVVTGFARCIYSYGTSRMTNIAVSACSATCVATGNTKLTGAHIAGCGAIGLQNNTNRTSMRIRSSSISTDASDPFCADNPHNCVGIYTDRRPKLTDSTCDTSGAPTSIQPSGTWNVCTLD